MMLYSHIKDCLREYELEVGYPTRNTTTPTPTLTTTNTSNQEDDDAEDFPFNRSDYMVTNSQKKCMNYKCELPQKNLHFCSLNHLFEYTKRITVTDWISWEKTSRAPTTTEELLEIMNSQIV